MRLSLGVLPVVHYWDPTVVSDYISQTRRSQGLKGNVSEISAFFNAPS